MMAIMQSLEPRFFKKDDLIYHDLEEVNEIMFVLKGDVSKYA